MSNRTEPMDCQESGLDTNAVQNQQPEKNDVIMADVGTSDLTATLNPAQQQLSVIMKQPQPTDDSVGPSDTMTWNLAHQQLDLFYHAPQIIHPDPQLIAAPSNPPIGHSDLAAAENQQPNSGGSYADDQSQDKSTQEKAAATGGRGPSAPLDSAKLNIRVEWTLPIPDRWKALLQKALQSWFNSTLFERVGENYNIVKLHYGNDNNHAEMEISPSRALSVLKKEKTVTLTLKNNSSAVVHFLDYTRPVTMKPVTTDPVSTECGPLSPELPVVRQKEPMPEVNMFFSADVDLDRYPQEVQSKLLKRMGKYKVGNKLSCHGSFVEVEKFYRNICDIVKKQEVGMETGAVRNDPKVEIPQNTRTTETAPAFIVPLHQYWYFSHTYKKEIDQIQDKFGVNINTEVSVSVTAKEQTRHVSVERASEKLTDLYQTSTIDLQSIPLPQTQLESETVRDALRYIQSDQAKMALMMSADGCILSGPKNTISGIENRLSSKFGQEFGKSAGSSVATKMENDRSSTPRNSTMEMDIKHTHDPIMMSDAMWELMKKTSHKQLTEIINKYGVQISNQHEQDSTTKVTIKSNVDQQVNLESHAYRAFIQLYQKISMSAITCPLTCFLDEKNVKNELEEHRLVGVQEKDGIRKLIGLPRNLAPAIAEIEKLVRKPVFDDKTKQLLDYSKNDPKKFCHSWKHLEGASSSAWELEPSEVPKVEAGHGNSKQKESDESKDDDCPICMDKFTDQKKLKCGHGFCRDCLKRSEMSMGEICPVCKKIYGKVKGNQPEGKMIHRKQRYDLPGYPGCGTIEITYEIPGGKQTDEHPNPGQYFSGTHRQAYLPNNPEGNEVLKLLKRAFDQKLIFTVGTSSTSGAKNTVTWNDIHHKTNTVGGPHIYGYPDPNYLKRVKDELKAKGIE